MHMMFELKFLKAKYDVSQDYIKNIRGSNQFDISFRGMFHDLSCEYKFNRGAIIQHYTGILSTNPHIINLKALPPFTEVNLGTTFKKVI